MWVPRQIKVPEMVTRSSGVSANFLCDNSKYILGIDAEGTNQRVRDCFEAAKEKHLSLLRETEGEMAEAVRNFLRRGIRRRHQNVLRSKKDGKTLQMEEI